MVKNYILDTNVLLQTEGRVIFGLDDNIVTIPGVVLEELDNMKSSPGEKGFAARECIRKIASFDNKKEKGTLKVELSVNTEELPDGWIKTKPDNMILATVQNLIKNNTNGPVILITNDIAMQIKARKLDIPVQNYRNDEIQDEEEYTGREVIENLPDEFIDQLYEKKQLRFGSSCIYGGVEVNLPSNKYLVLKSISKKSALARSLNNEVELINKDRYSDIFGISPKNAGQAFAVHALMAPVDDVPFVILKGCAGTGKTILALAAGLKQMEQGMYDKIIITRSNAMDKNEDLGFLPGDLEAKMEPLLAPFYDNLRYLFKFNGEDDEQTKYIIDDMIERGSIEIVSLAYIRGRSIPNAYIIVDEVQNCSPLQAKTLLTRIGLGSKLVFLGDVGQIDSSHLDRKSNGLAYVSEKFKKYSDPKESGCIQMSFSSDESVRSKLAKFAIEILEDNK